MIVITGIVSLACGISPDVHDAVILEKEVLEKEKEAAQATIAQLENDKVVLQEGLTKAQDKLQNLEAVFPPKRFKNRAAITNWLNNDDISKRPGVITAESLFARALEQQARALEDGYIISADFSGPDIDFNFIIWMSAVTESSDYFTWDVQTDEVIWQQNIDLFE